MEIRVGLSNCDGRTLVPANVVMISQKDLFRENAFCVLTHMGRFHTFFCENFPID
jgi:hypothetical protein